MSRWCCCWLCPTVMVWWSSALAKYTDLPEFDHISHLFALRPHLYSHFYVKLNVIVFPSTNLVLAPPLHLKMTQFSPETSHACAYMCNTLHTAVFATMALFGDWEGNRLLAYTVVDIVLKHRCLNTWNVSWEIVFSFSMRLLFTASSVLKVSLSSD